MLKFLNSFSAPLIGSLSFWPFLCILLTIPFIISRLIMRRRVTWSYVFFSYGSILYFTGLIFFTLSPVPKDPIAFCQTHHIQPQLIPFNWVNYVVHPNKDTLYITLQLVMNIVFFVPLGIFMKAYFHKHWKFALLSGFLLSMLIEVTQLTGVFGLYPCSYRLFDVNDLITNTFGCLLGFMLTWLIGYKVPSVKLSDENYAAPNRRNKFLASCINIALIIFASVVTRSLVYPFFIDTIQPGRFYLTELGVWIIIQLFIIPRVAKGWTIGSYLVGIKPKRQRKSDKQQPKDDANPEN